jgi:hypothetical protein
MGGNMDCQKLIETYLSDVKKDLSIEHAEKGCILYTPHLDPSNDTIRVFIEEINDKIRISDISHVDEYLYLHGIDIKPKSTVEWNFNRTLNRLNIKSDGSELFVDVDKEDLADGINRIVNAIISLDNLTYTSKARMNVDFQVEVADWLTENHIIYKPRVNFVERLAAPPVIVDFVIPRVGKKPIFLGAFHSESKQYADTLAYKWHSNIVQLHAADYKFCSSVILDDVEENIWDKAYKLFNTYADSVIYWEDRNDILPILA